MTALRYAVLDGGGVIRNLIVRDPADPWEPPEGHTAEECRDGVDYYMGLKPGEKPPPAPEPAPEDRLPDPDAPA